jgi:hypothetical protein
MPLRATVRALELVGLNCLVFLGYRLLFLHEFAGTATARSAALLHGLRLDVALLGIEAAVVTVAALLRRRARAGFVLGLAWAVTYLNIASLVANLVFFRERNQHLWEMLLANLGRPDEVYVALEPFLDLHPFFLAGWLVATGAFVLLARRRVVIAADRAIDLWRERRALTIALGVLVLGIATNVEPVVDQKGGRLGTTASKYYMDFPDYVVNQAVVNPMFDLLHYYGPSLLAKRRYRLQAPEALQASRALLDLGPSADPRYPLLQTIRGEGGLGIENVVLLQVESLGTTVLERRAGDGWVMPYLHELAEQGLYFPNLIQSFCATDGSTFATATSLHRTFGPSEGVSRFLPNEVNGHYGCLSRILGSETHHHYFFAGFKQRTADFLSFMGNQGYDARGYAHFLERLGPRAERESNNLGIYDGPMLREVADVLVATPGRFTAYVATTTSHSPWKAPDDMPARLPEAGLNTFRYTDQSIRAFVETLRAHRPDFDRTLFVVFGDHTSITFGDGLTERIRVPLILYSPELARRRARWAERIGAWGSHVDILPTVLGLLDGPHLYGGMGRNLLDPRAADRGLISSTYVNSLYIRDGFALRYAPHNRTTQLFAIVDGEIVPRDVSAAHPEVVARLKREHLALYETSDRLVREKRVFPRSEVAARALAPAQP